MPLPKPGGRHWNFYVALGLGIGAAVLTLLADARLFPAAGASTFSLAYLFLTARDIPKLTPDYLRRHASDEDAPPFVVFVLTLAIVAYVTTDLFVVANGSQHNLALIGLGVVSVVLAWLMIHVMWGMHYAWEYYEAPPTNDEKAAAGKPAQRGGLDFPGDELPDGMAFVYFSLVVAMTSQTSDTDVANNKMRRIVTGHSLFSYLFNTVGVAAAVNIVVSLSSKS